MRSVTDAFLLPPLGATVSGICENEIMEMKSAVVVNRMSFFITISFIKIKLIRKRHCCYELLPAIIASDEK
jgi:hypothetical protein